MSVVQNQQAQYMIDVRKVAAILSISTRSVWRLVASEEFPQPIRFGRNVRWRLAEVEAWIEARATSIQNDNPRHPR